MPIPTNAPTINVIGNVKLDIDTPKTGNSLTRDAILVLKNANIPPALLTFINKGPKTVIAFPITLINKPNIKTNGPKTAANNPNPITAN
ncbi:Uncharacterised protein [Staphylococcus aureus]|nr:Uncharacterised protein [Staphylococcus aureus]